MDLLKNSMDNEAVKLYHNFTNGKIESDNWPKILLEKKDRETKSNSKRQIPSIFFKDDFRILEYNYDNNLQSVVYSVAGGSAVKFSHELPKISKIKTLVNKYLVFSQESLIGKQFISKLIIIDPFIPNIDINSILNNANDKQADENVRDSRNSTNNKDNLANKMIVATLKYQPNNQILDFDILGESLIHETQSAMNKDRCEPLICILRKSKVVDDAIEKKKVDQDTFFVDIWNFKIPKIKIEIPIKLSRPPSPSSLSQARLNDIEDYYEPKHVQFLNQNEITIAGRNFFKHISIEDGVINQNTSLKTQKFVHKKIIKFANNSLCSLTDDNHLLIIDKTRVKLDTSTINVAEFEIMDLKIDLENVESIQDICKIHQYLAVLTNHRFICIMRYDETNNELSILHIIHPIMSLLRDQERNCEDFESINESICLERIEYDANSNMMIATSKSGQIYKVFFEPENLNAENRMSFMEMLLHQPHQNEITCITSSERKPYMVTCCTEGKISVWNYKNKSLELALKISSDSDRIQGMDIHPNGLFVAISSQNKIKIYSLFFAGLKLYSEIQIRSPSIVKFSNNGAFMASVGQNYIQIFSTLNYERICLIRLQDIAISCLQWSASDDQLVTGSTCGRVLQWTLVASTSTYARLDASKVLDLEIIDEPSKSGDDSKSDGKTLSIIDIQLSKHDTLLTDDSGQVTEVSKLLIYVLASDNVVRELIDGAIVNSLRPQKNCRFVALATSCHEKRLYLASEDGRIYRPGHGKPFRAISGRISKMCISKCRRYLQIGGNDGQVTAMKLGNWSKSAEIERNWSDDILVCRSDIDYYRVQVSELDSEKKELILERDYQLKLKSREYEETLESVKSELNKKVEGLSQKMAILTSEKDRVCGMKDQRLQEVLEENRKEIRELEEQHFKRMASEFERQKTISGALEEKIRENEELSAKFSATLETKTAEYEALRKVSNDENKRYEIEKKEAIKQFEADLAHWRAIDEEASCQAVCGIRNELDTRLNEQHETLVKLNGENSIMKKRFGSMKSEIEESREQVTKRNSEIKKLQQSIKNLEQQIATLNKQIAERDNLVEEKGRKISLVQKKNLELDKYKFVLENKIEELDNQVAPLEQENEKYQILVGKMEEELVAKNKIEADLNLKLSSLQLKIEAKQKDFDQQLANSNALKSQLNNILHDLTRTMEGIQDPKKLKISMIEINKRYLDSPGLESNTNSSLKDEASFKIKFLEETVRKLNASMARLSTQNNANYRKLLDENRLLLSQLNEAKRSIALGGDKQPKRRSDAQKYLTKKSNYTGNSSTVFNPDPLIRVAENEKRCSEISSRLKDEELVRMSAEIQQLKEKEAYFEEALKN
ncbi:MAG: Cilia- and flagella-associated protein 57 [Marteilia pararefringens]